MNNTSLTEEPKIQMPILRKLNRQKWFLSSFSIIFTGLVTAYIFTCPDVYQAKTFIVFPQRLPTGGGSMAMMETLGGGMGGAPIRMFMDLLTSDRVLTYVASHSDLNKGELKNKLTLKDHRMSSALNLFIEDKNFIKAQKISRLFVSQLRELNTELNIPSVETEHKTILKELTTKSADLAIAEQKLQQFIENSKTAPSSSMTKEGFMPGSKWLEQQKTIQAELIMLEGSINKIKAHVHLQSGKHDEFPSKVIYLQKWRDRLAKLEYDLKIKETSLGPEAPDIILLKDGIKITKEKLKEETQKYVASTDKEISEELADLTAKRAGMVAALEHVNKMVDLFPKEALEFQRLTRETMILTTIVNQLRQQSELLAMSSVRDPNKWHVIDDASVIGPVNKGLAKPLGIGLVGSIILGVPLALRREKMREKKMYASLRS